MNLQTVKARARWVGGSQYAGPMWVVEHPLAKAMYFTDLPHDAAVHMIREYALPRHAELLREREAKCSVK